MDSPIISQVRTELDNRGAKTIRLLGRVFRNQQSYNGGSKVTAEDFILALHEVGVNFSKNDNIALITYLDPKKTGQVCFIQFLESIRGIPNSQRQALIDKAFLKFDAEARGYINAASLQKAVCFKFNPQVMKGQISDEQAFIQFLAHFKDIDVNGTISRGEWNDYYGSVSASVNDDQHFVALVRSTWSLD